MSPGMSRGIPPGISVDIFLGTPTILAKIPPENPSEIPKGTMTGIHPRVRCEELAQLFHEKKN